MCALPSQCHSVLGYIGEVRAVVLLPTSFYPTCSAKDVEDLLTEVEDLNFSEEKREDKPKKEKKKVIFVGS